MRLIIGLLLSLVCSSSFAAFSWQGPYTVKNVTSASLQGSVVTSVTVNEASNIKSGCAIADEKGVMSYWSSGGGFWHSQWLSTLLSAQAQNKPVMIYVDWKQCNSSFGASFSGVKVLGE